MKHVLEFDCTKEELQKIEWFCKGILNLTPKPVEVESTNPDANSEAYKFIQDYYSSYLTGKITLTGMMRKYNLSQSGFYRRIKSLNEGGHNLPNVREYKKTVRNSKK